MLHRFVATAFLGCSLVGLTTVNAVADETRTKSIMPVPDPTFSPELSSEVRVLGRLMIDALKDVDKSRELANQTSSEARHETRLLLTNDWQLQFEIDEKGKLHAGSTRFVFDAVSGPDRPGAVRLPKPVVLFGLKVQLSSQEGGLDVEAGGTPEHQALPSDDELDLICGPDWIITWLEDENGQIIEGTTELLCGGESYPVN
ncbi:MAG: hypothetical protein ACE361_01130 [Aureliella sp.]